MTKDNGQIPGRSTERLKIAKATAVFILCAMSFLLCFSCSQTKYTAEYYDVFDTYTVVVSYGKPVPPELHEEMLRLHNLFDIYNGEIDLSDAEVQWLLAKSDELKAVSGGTFDITFGALKVWHSYREDGVKVPAIAELREAKPTIDLGAIAKGYAVGKVGELAESLDLIGTISIGGSVWTSENMPSGKTNWTLAIQNPDGGIYQTIEVPPGMCASTSGDYERYYEVDGTRYHHIIDPRTLYPSRQRNGDGKLVRSVTILCRDSLTADFLSTAEFVQRDEDLLTIYDAEAIWIYES
ncbi:MAG: FAD:protein FMN transferase [Oscillospiraceae bacterium]|jgi:thiamine biosynthesis lipoprotein|nr:FAD:protein FMN transferase [Oscillospiraceae bacterium]